MDLNPAPPAQGKIVYLLRLQLCFFAVLRNGFVNVYYVSFTLHFKVPFLFSCVLSVHHK